MKSLKEIHKKLKPIPFKKEDINFMGNYLKYLEDNKIKSRFDFKMKEEISPEYYYVTDLLDNTLLTEIKRYELNNLFLELQTPFLPLVNHQVIYLMDQG